MLGSGGVVWVPIAVAAVTVLGLIVSLLGSAPWAWMSWIALAAPLVLIVERIIAGLRRR